MSKTIQNGGFTDPAGNLVTGNLLLVLSQDAKVAATPNQVAPKSVRLPVNGGNIAATSIYFNDELLPNNTFYTATVYDSTGNKVYGPELVSFAGAGPLDLGTLTPLLISPDPLFSNPVLQNPATSQTISGQSLTLASTAPLVVQGTATFSGTNLDTKYLGAVRVICNKAGASAGWAGADVSVWIANAQADLPSTGGILDATSCIGTQTVSQEIDVGNSSQLPVRLLLPHSSPNGSTWVSAQAGGTAYVLKVFSRSSVIGFGTGEGQSFTIAAGATANVDSVCGNDPTNGQYVRMEGFACQAVAGATVAKAVFHVTGAVDESYYGHITTYTQSSNANKALWVHNSCCSARFESINAETSGAPGASGAVPCTFGNGATDSNTGIQVEALSCVHPSTGKNALVIQQNGGGNGNVFKGIYMEQCSTGIGCTFNQDLTTAYVSIQANGSPSSADTFIGLTANVDSASSTRYAVDVASGSHVNIFGLRSSPVSTNIVNDHNTGAIAVTGSVSTTINYTTEPSFGPSFQMYNASSAWKLFPVGTGFNIQQVSPSSFAWQFGTGGSTVTLANSATGARTYTFPDLSINVAGAIASGTAAMTTAAITAGNCGTTVTVAAAGVATTDTVIWAFNAAPAGSNAGIVAWPTSGNVNFAYCPGVAETPAAATINWRVVR